MSVEEKIYREKLVLAPILDRLLAFLIDYFLISFVFSIIFWDELSPLQGDYVSVMNFVNERILYFMTLNLSYEFLFVYLYGATLGKIALKIKIISSEMLDRPSLIYSIVRTLCKFIGMYLFFAPFFVVFFSPIQQTLHDILGKTLVIKNA